MHNFSWAMVTDQQEKHNGEKKSKSFYTEMIQKWFNNTEKVSGTCLFLS